MKNSIRRLYMRWLHRNAIRQIRIIKMKVIALTEKDVTFQYISSLDQSMQYSRILIAPGQKLKCHIGDLVDVQVDGCFVEKKAA